MANFASNEVVVAGVYLRLFVANPGWAVRKPKEFLNELMDTCLSLMNKEKTDVSFILFLCCNVKILIKLRLFQVDMLEIATNALVALLQAQPTLGNHVPSLGYVPRLIKQMTQIHSSAIPRAVLMLHQLALNEVWN